MPQAQVDQELSRGAEALRHGQLDAALEAFQAAVAASPDNPKALALLGLAHFRSGNFTGARPVFEELVRIVPADASHRLNLGLVFLKLGDTERAVKELEASRELDPSQGRAASYLGLAYARAGRYVEAYQAFLQAGQSDLAREVEEHLTPIEKAAIDTHLVDQKAGRASALPGSSAAPVRAMTEDDSQAVRFVSPTPPPMSSPEIQVLAGARSVAGLPLPEPEPTPAARPADAKPAEPARGKEARAAAPAKAKAKAKDGAPAAVPEPGAGESAISRAVAQAAPSGSVAIGGTKVAPGSVPPMPLSEFATSRLVRPEDGDYPFEISSTGVLVVRVTDRVYSRTEGVDVTGGQLAYEPATRRSRGTQTTEAFDDGDRPMFLVTGQGQLIAMPLGGVFTAVQLDDDILYLREDHVFAFEAHLRWENGHVPGSRSKIRMVQFRGSGAVAFRTPKPLIAIKLTAPGVLYVDATAIAGWIGRVVPRALLSAGGGQSAVLFVECSGEGVVLVEEDAGRDEPASSSGAP